MSYVNGIYGHLQPIGLLAGAGLTPQVTEVDIGATSGDVGDFLCVRPCDVVSLQFTPTSEAAGGSGTAPTVVFTKRPTPLSASGATAIGTLTVPHGTAVGTTVYKDVTPVNLQVGDCVHIAWTVGITGPTGIGLATVIVNDDPEYRANNSEMIASA